MVVSALAGCGDSAVDSSFGRADDYLIKVGNKVVTVIDFNKALEITKTAYPYNVIKDPVSFKGAQLRRLNQMIDELILQKRAEELNIRIADSKVEKAIADIKRDYPEGVFEQTFLECAVSYNSWKKGLKIRLLMEMVIAKDLGEQTAITSEDISKYYAEHYQGNSLRSGLKERCDDGNENINDLIIKNIRREKTENAYKTWIVNLKRKYAVEINQAQWEKITGS